MSIAERLTEIRVRILAAARSAGRDPSSVRLVAVSKTFPLESIREAFEAGQRDFGENRVQEALQKVELALQKIEGSADQSIRWHLLGHLQTNKARKAAAGVHGDSVGRQCRAHPEAGPDGRGHRTRTGPADSGGSRGGSDQIRRDARGGAAALRGRGRMSRRQGCRADDASALARNARRLATLVPPAARPSRPVAGVRCSRIDASRAVDGHERGFRGGHSGRRHHGAGRYGDIWEPTCRTLKTSRRPSRRGACRHPTATPPRRRSTCGRRSSTPPCAGTRRPR